MRDILLVVLAVGTLFLLYTTYTLQKDIIGLYEYLDTIYNLLDMIHNNTPSQGFNSYI
jgi:hypothetical protein